jgi:potassium-transporting ATPase KdpC subunit
MMKALRPALVTLLAFTLLTGVAYPGAVTALAQLTFKWRANGSVIVSDRAAVGSALIGQPFSDPRYFWSRPSATIPVPYNAGASAASNYGPSNPALLDSEVTPRIARLRAVDPSNTAAVPVDLVTSSASGLDPDISPAAAIYQVDRVARVRGLDRDTVRQLVTRHISGRLLGLWGEPCVNVVSLNLALDSLFASPPSRPHTSLTP